MMETNMIERVAKAIWQANHDENHPEEFRIWKIEDPNFSSSVELATWERDDYRIMARAVNGEAFLATVDTTKQPYKVVLADIYSESATSLTVIGGGYCNVDVLCRCVIVGGANFC